MRYTSEEQLQKIRSSILDEDEKKKWMLKRLLPNYGKDIAINEA